MTALESIRDRLNRIAAGHTHEVMGGLGHCARHMDNDVPCRVVEEARAALRELDEIEADLRQPEVKEQ